MYEDSTSSRRPAGSRSAGTCRRFDLRCLANAEEREKRRHEEPGVEPSGGATKFSYDIERSGGKIAYYFVTKLDGAEVPAISNGTEIMKIRVKRIGPYEFDSSSTVQGTETRFKTIVSKDGNVMTTDGTIATQGKSIPSHVVFDRVK
jgi:hypothetical protein